MPEPRMVSVTKRSKGADRSMAAALQQRAAAFEPWLPYTGSVRRQTRPASGSALPSDGAERCGTWGLRAPPRRTTVPQGANQGSNPGGRLKLNLVRRNWAGQGHHLLKISFFDERCGQFKATLFGGPELGPATCEVDPGFGTG